MKAPGVSTKQKKGRNKAKHTNKQKPTNQTKTLKAEKKINWVERANKASNYFVSIYLYGNFHHHFMFKQQQ